MEWHLRWPSSAYQLVNCTSVGTCSVHESGSSMHKWTGKSQGDKKTKKSKMRCPPAGDRSDMMRPLWKKSFLMIRTQFANMAWSGTLKGQKKTIVLPGWLIQSNEKKPTWYTWDLHSVWGLRGRQKWWRKKNHFMEWQNCFWLWGPHLRSRKRCLEDIQWKWRKCSLWVFHGHS